MIMRRLVEGARWGTRPRPGSVSVRPSPPGREFSRYVERFSPNAITAVLVGVAGITFLVRAGGGLYWLIPAAVASLVGGVINAWLFLVRSIG
jgi:hypothetical protein